MPRRFRSARLLATASLLASSCAVGCWEQISYQWFPQMKRQPAIQAYEANTLLPDQIDGLMPPEGTVAVGSAGIPDVATLPLEEQEAIQNPVPASLESLKRGEVLFKRNCATCHGAQGGGDGPVAGAPFGKGPLGLVLPIGGPMSVSKGLTDGHIYTTISIGRGRMPAYRRIPPQQRWDVINYLRELNGQGGRQ